MSIKGLLKDNLYELTDALGKVIARDDRVVFISTAVGTELKFGKVIGFNRERKQATPAMIREVAVLADGSKHMSYIRYPKDKLLCIDQMINI